jgi:predicted AAA+ superfamily ATPase
VPPSLVEKWLPEEVAMKFSGDQAAGLRSLLAKDSLRVALFVSGVRRAGKTTAIANLALAGAQQTPLHSAVVSAAVMTCSTP